MVQGAKPRTQQDAQGALGARFLAFVVEQQPFLVAAARKAWAKHAGPARTPDDVRAVGARVVAALLDDVEPSVAGLPETTPFVSAAERMSQERARAELALAGFFVRAAVEAGITPEEKRWLLRGVITTRAVDNRMKQMFLSSELKYGDQGFQGKGFRSLGQEAVYGAALRLRRGERWFVDGRWTGDVAAPLIRDLGVFLAFTDDDVTSALNAQAGKVGPPMDGRDLHTGAPDRGVLHAAAPLSIATCTVTGFGLAFARRREPRVALSFIGEGGSSLGEWHEAVNFAAAQRLPVVYCVQNNQTALSTPVAQQSRVRVFAEKAVGYGIPHVTVDGTDPEAIAAAFSWAADRARAGDGPSLVELVAMRMCGHAHHDDMLYLGGDPPLSFALPPLSKQGYVDADKYARWAARDPLARYAGRLIDDGVVGAEEVARWQDDAKRRCDDAMDDLKARPWPDPRTVGDGVLGADVAPPAHPPQGVVAPPLPGGIVVDDVGTDAVVEDAPPFSPAGVTYLEAVGRGVGDALARRPEAIAFGEDVGPPYGGAFLLLKPIATAFSDRVFNTPLAEGAILGAAVGAALAGMRPIAEIQFNDFVASGFNQVVNNAAKLRYRTGRAVPMVVRLPWGGLRRAGPYHSQDTAPWFFRTPGLKIVAPSTPHDARALLVAAVDDDDPVLFYEHIALYRDPKVKQVLDEQPGRVAIGRAAFRRVGADLSLITYGAFVHRALRTAEALAADGVQCDVLDLRTLQPLDWEAIARTVKRTGKVLLVGEDSRTGSILESIASRVGESMLDRLDAPVRVLGALDAPVPYAPSLEDAYLVTQAMLDDAARTLAAY